MLNSLREPKENKKTTEDAERKQAACCMHTHIHVDSLTLRDIYSELFQVAICSMD